MWICYPRYTNDDPPGSHSHSASPKASGALRVSPKGQKETAHSFGGFRRWKGRCFCQEKSGRYQQQLCFLHVLSIKIGISPTIIHYEFKRWIWCGCSSSDKWLYNSCRGFGHIYICIYILYYTCTNKIYTLIMAVKILWLSLIKSIARPRMMISGELIWVARTSPLIGYLKITCQWRNAMASSQARIGRSWNKPWNIA